jgi:hypothetical protein
MHFGNFVFCFSILATSLLYTFTDHFNKPLSCWDKVILFTRWGAKLCTMHLNFLLVSFYTGAVRVESLKAHDYAYTKNIYVIFLFPASFIQMKRRQNKI